MKLLETTADITPAILEDVEEVWEGWFADEPTINWELFLDRLCSYGNIAEEPYDIESFDNPAVRKIRRHVSALRAGS